MVMMKEEIKRKIAEVLSSFPEVWVGYVFGSFLTGRFSDVDVAVLLSEEPPHYESLKLSMRIARELERATGFRFEFDVKVLNSSPIYFQHEVIRSGEVVFCRDERKRINYEASVLSEYLDYEPVLRWFDEKLLEEIEGVR
jgi:predicted nucleotidyltransferase